MTGIYEVTTDLVRSRDRLSFWRETALRRVEPERVFRETNFHGRLRRLAGSKAELWDHRGSAIWVRRSQQQCNRDGCGDIGVALVLDCDGATIENGCETRLGHGDIYVMDYARPVRAMRPDHRELALLIPRESVTNALGGDLSALAGAKLTGNGIGAVLRAHLRSTADEAGDLSEAEREVAVDTAVDITLALLSRLVRRSIDPEQHASAYHAAALRIIRQRAADPLLNPERIAQFVGCSRSSLYRAFAGKNGGVARAIWDARLLKAQALLSSAASASLPIGEIARRSGFLDSSSFSRMFKARFGISPSTARG